MPPIEQKTLARRSPSHALLPLLLLLLLLLQQHDLLCPALSVGMVVGNAGGGQHNNKFKMFKARYPLEGGPPQVKLHVAIIVEEETRGVAGNDGERVNNEKDGHSRSPPLVLFDFLPAEPTARQTTFRLLTGQDVRGNLRERNVRFLPPGSVYVGRSDATLEDMRGFVTAYPDRLSLISNNCVSFVDAFIARHRLEQD